MQLLHRIVSGGRQNNAVDGIVDALQLGKIVTKATVRREDILEPEFLQMLSRFRF